MLIKYNAEPTASLFHKDNSFVRGIMGPIGCLPSYTEFLTPHGWKSIDNFTDGDLVAGYDMQSACVQYVKPLDYIKKSATQWVVLQSKSSTFKLVMSDDHYMPVTSRCVGERPGINVHDRQYTKVDALTLAKVKGQKRLLSCYFINDRSPCDIVPTPLIQYAVALNADGHIPKDTQQCATFGFNKERKARRLMLILDELKSIYPDMRYSYKTYALHGRKAKVSDTYYVIRVRNAPYLGKTFDSPFFWQMGGSELRVLVDELVHWDGHLRGATGYEKKLVVFDTSRESDVGFIQYAANACGYRSTVTVAQPTSTRHSALYRVALISPGSIKHPMCLRKGYVSSSIVDGSTTDPQYGDGYKYCFTMPTGYFLIRQHGQVFVSSNSGKSCACCLEILQRALKQTPAPDGFRYSRWAIIRNSYPELKSTTIKTWQDWIPEDICQIKWDAPINAKMRLSDIGDGTGIDMEVIFLALDRPQDVKKLLSLELTGAWINEAKEIDRGVLSMLTGRVGRYPSKSKMDGKKYWSGIIMDTNPMDEDHWYYHLAEEERPVGYRFFRQPGALLYRDGKYVINPLAENIKNHTLGYDYYTRQVPGKDHEWIKVYLMGEYGAVMDGKPVYSEYSDMVHCPPVDVMPLDKTPITVAFDFGLCYSDDTEVLTINGWKLFKDVGDNEPVATKNMTTNKLEYHIPEFKVDKPYKGKMLEWSSTEVNMCVTPEHIIPCRDDHHPDVLHWKSAQWLSERNTGHWRVDLTSMSSDLANGDKQTFFGMSSSVFAKMMGIYLSEGHTSKQGNSYKITIYQKTQVERIDDMLRQTGLNWKYYNGKAPGWVVTNNDLGPYLHSFGHAGQKRVPREIADMGTSEILDFIDFYTLGDGHIRTKPNGSVEHTLFTISERMSADMQELAQKVGWNSSVRLVKPQKSTITENGVPRVITNNGGYSVTFKKSAKSARLHRSNFREVDYDGRVYCLNVPHHTLYVRRGGKTHWNGNTPACVIGQLSARGQLIVLDELVSENMGIRQFATDVVLPFLSTKYSGFSISSVGDPAGIQRSQSNEATCMDELRNLGLPTEPAHTNDFTARREAVAGFLNKLVDGQPGFVLSQNCRKLRKGFLGGYCYKRVQVSGQRFRDKPDKNEYSHPHDALQYLALSLTEQRNRIVKASKRMSAPEGGNRYNRPMDDIAGY